ncbi:hypothetical protein GBAR_LOCUS28823 [Geodia barretti]|uniref:Uncharacterized protein n=1 Tax=Geodia barretti TaxID=519541 RepID=A0AA35TRJ2_GEOBA|nr:hypothetical protein GBAR_LOCUS28823 [Geodia barretti]
MGYCRHCGDDAGFLRNSHRECEDANRDGWQQMLSLSSESALSGRNRENLVTELGDLATSSFVPSEKIRDALLEGWEQAVQTALGDHLISREEETNLADYAERFHLPQEELDRNGARTSVIQGSVIREVVEGNLPDRQQVVGQIPFNLQKSEKLVWVFEDVSYLEERVQRERVGGAQGASIRVMRGVYYHTGGFRSRTVETTVTEKMDVGLMGLTNKHIYFAGSSKRFRVAYNRIVAFDPFSDGFGIMREAQTARPQMFITGNGWFVYNMVTNLAQM